MGREALMKANLTGLGRNRECAANTGMYAGVQVYGLLAYFLT